MPIESPAVVGAYFSSVSATVETTLPNYLLATPTYATPPYAFNTSIPVTLGEIVGSDLATSTYLPIVASIATGSTALPVLLDQYTVVTTDGQGDVITSTYHITEPSVVLGEPPGWNGVRTLRAPVTALGCSLFVAVCAAAWIF